MTSVMARPKNHDAFLASMTFANGCICEECEEIDAKTMSSNIPPTIADALQKRRKVLNEQVVLCQERELVARLNSGAAIWKWTLPPGSDPLIEFGDSHRIVYVEKCEENRIVKSVGKGIIGSSHETKHRVVLPLKEKKGYFLRSNEGRATGFINEVMPSDKELNIDDDSHDVVLYILKITISIIKDFEENSDNVDDLTAKIVTVVKKHLTDNIDETTAEEKKDFDLKVTSEEDVSIIEQILAAVQEEPGE